MTVELTNQEANIIISALREMHHRLLGEVTRHGLDQVVEYECHPRDVRHVIEKVIDSA